MELSDCEKIVNELLVLVLKADDLKKHSETISGTLRASYEVVLNDHLSKFQPLVDKLYTHFNLIKHE